MTWIVITELGNRCGPFCDRKTAEKAVLALAAMGICSTIHKQEATS